MRIMAIALGLLVFAGDWITKWYVKTNVSLHYYPVIDGFFSIHYVQNEGIAFGLFHNLQSDWKPLVLSAMAIIAVLIVLYYILTTPSSERMLFVSLGLLLGGILGNFTDRLLHQYVVDFLELHWGDRFMWPTFNLADAGITTGVLLILYETFFKEESDKAEQEEKSLKAGNEEA